MKKNNLTAVFITAFCGFILGALFSYGVMKITTPIYPKYKFVPQYMGYKKDTPMQILKTQKEVDIVRKSNIRTGDKATIGAAVANAPAGYYVITTEEFASGIFNIEPIPNAKEMTGDTFVFTPNAIGHRKPMELDIIDSPVKLQALMHDKRVVDSADELQMGAAVNEFSKDHFIIHSKKQLETNFTLKSLYEPLNSNSSVGK